MSAEAKEPDRSGERAPADHPGWALWEESRQDRLRRWEEGRAFAALMGRPEVPPPDIPEDPGRAHLDMLVQRQVQTTEESRRFRYEVVTWSGQGITQVVATRSNVRGGQESVLHDHASGRWIYDPASMGEIRHQARTEGKIEMRRVSRQEAEQVASATKGVPLPSEEDLFRMCEQQLGRELGMSMTESDLARSRQEPSGEA